MQQFTCVALCLLSSTAYAEENDIAKAAVATSTLATTEVLDVAPCVVAHYSFGTAVTYDGIVLFTEFNCRTIRDWNPKTRRVKTWRAKETPGMFDVATSTAGDVFVGLDLGDTNSPGKILRIGADSQEEYLVENITRPRQLTCDTVGNVFVVMEGGQVLKWDKASTTVKEIMTALPPASGVAVGADDSLYVSEYGDFETAPEGYSRPSAPGQVKVKRPHGSVSVLAKGFWRARGLAISGRNLYLCTESNREDQGNAGQLVRIDTVTGAREILLDKLDYPQFPAVSGDGLVYFTLARDNCLVSFDPAAPFHDVACPVDGVTRSTVRGGNLTWGTVPSGIPFLLQVQSIRIKGFLQPNPRSKQIDGWIDIPADRFQLKTSDLHPHHDRDYPTPGVFETPRCESHSGLGSIRVEVFPLRRHQGTRWPMQNVGTAEESPAPGFSEQPESFRFYYHWSKPEAAEPLHAHHAASPQKDTSNSK